MSEVATFRRWFFVARLLSDDSLHRILRSACRLGSGAGSEPAMIAPGFRLNDGVRPGGFFVFHFFSRYRLIDRILVCILSCVLASPALAQEAPASTPAEGADASAPAEVSEPAAPVAPAGTEAQDVDARSGAGEAAAPAPAPAEPAGPDPADQEEIIVTTERRRQSIQRVPGSVQAITFEDLQVKGVGSDFRNLQFVVPGLHITNQEGQLEVFIRGIGSTNNDFSSDPAVATHYNGIYISRPRGIGPMFYDSERIEVNKGPQGTLRGRNATGGTINIISRRPDLYNYGGYVQSGFGNFDALQLEGAVNVPIVDGLAVRGAVFHERHGSYYSNALNNGVEAPGQQSDVAFRVSGLWEPTPQLSAYVVFDWAEQNGTGDPGQFWGGSLSAGFDSGDLDDPREQFFLQEGDFRNKLWGILGVVKYDFGPVILEYNSGFRRYDFLNKNAQRPFQQGVNYPGVDTSRFELDNFGTLYQLEESDALVQEVRIYSPDDSRFRWTGGAFFYREEFGRVSWDITDRTLTQGNLGGQSVTLPESNVESLAFFGDATFDITPALRVRAGARFTTEDKEEDGFQVQYAFDFGENVTADDVRSGTPGFELKPASELRLTDPAAADPAQQFLDAVRSFGARDTVDDLIAENPGSVSLTTSSPAGREATVYDASYFNWRVGLEYDLARRSMVYATASTGTRSGGINPTITLPDGTRLPVTFDPEDLLVFELGSKNRFMLGGLPLRLNGAAFFYRYTDQVLQSLVAAQGSGGGVDEQQNFLTNANAGTSTLIGVELEGDLFLPWGFTLGWNAAYLNSRYGDTVVNESRLFQEADFIDYDGDGDTEELLPQVNVNLEGGPLQNASDLNVALTLRQVIPFDGVSFDWAVHYLFRSEFFYTPFGGRGFDFNGNEIPIAEMTRPSDSRDQNGNFLSDRVPSVHVVNLNAGVTFGEEIQLRVDGYVTNLTNEAFPGKGFVNAFVNIRYLNNPRTFGLRVTGTL